MGRARTIKPAFFLNCELGELPALARLLFVGLWTLADRDGLLKDEPKKIKIQLLPWDECDVNELLNHLMVGNFIQRYEAEGIACIEILNFAKHQNIHPKEASSNLPFHLKKCKKISFPGKKVIKGRIVKEGIEGIVKEGKEGAPPETFPVPTPSPEKKRLVPGIPEDCIPETLRTPEFVDAFHDWKQHKRERGETYKPTGLAALLKKLDAMGPEAAAAAISHSIAANYAGIYPAPTAKPTGGGGGQTFLTAHERKLEREAALVARAKELDAQKEAQRNDTKRSDRRNETSPKPLAAPRTIGAPDRRGGNDLRGNRVSGSPNINRLVAEIGAKVCADTGRDSGSGANRTAAESAKHKGGTSRDAIGAEAAELVGSGRSEDQSLKAKL